jgi:hypothetical protein
MGVLMENTDLQSKEKWFNTLPDGYRELALWNLHDPKQDAWREKNYFKVSESIRSTILFPFNWAETPEGFSFWEKVSDYYTPTRKELPYIPKIFLRNKGIPLQTEEESQGMDLQVANEVHNTAKFPCVCKIGVIRGNSFLIKKEHLSRDMGSSIDWELITMQEQKKKELWNWKKEVGYREQNLKICANCRWYENQDLFYCMKSPSYFTPETDGVCDKWEKDQ